MLSDLCTFIGLLNGRPVKMKSCKMRSPANETQEIVNDDKRLKASEQDLM